MGEVTCNAERFADQVCVVDVLVGGERGADDPLSCSHYALQQGLPAGCSAAAVRHSDAAGQDALGGSTVKKNNFRGINIFMSDEE